MSSKKSKAALNQIKNESAQAVGVTLNQGYNGELTSRQAGSIGGEMVKRMVASYENNASNSNYQSK